MFVLIFQWTDWFGYFIGLGGLGVSLNSVVWCASGLVVFGVSIDFVVWGISVAGSLCVFQWTGVKVGCFSRLGGTGSCMPQMRVRN